MKKVGPDKTALETLKAEILNTDACTACGACVNLCPNIISLDDRIAAIGDCRLDNGRCLRYCPRTKPAPEIKGILSGDAGFKNPLGQFRDITLALGNLSAKGRPFQCGGVVSALLWQAMQDNLINCAVVTRSFSNIPKAVTIWKKEEIFDAVGSKFALSPTNQEVNLAAMNPDSRIGVVALPCQATALRKKQLLEADADRKEGKVVLIIGLFCTWALEQQGWRAMLREYVGNESIQRIDIPPPPADAIEITTDKRTFALSLHAVRNHIRVGCKVCLDMTAENADVSVGMAEGVAGYNTLINRSDIGKKLVERAFKQDLLKAIPYDKALLKYLENASMNKKIRAIDEAERRAEPSAYYRHLKKLKHKIMN